MRQLALLTIVSVVFFLLYPRLDIAWSAFFMEPGAGHSLPHAFFSWERHPVVWSVYVWVKIIAYSYAVFLAMAGLYKLVCGTQLIRWQSWRFLMLALLVGPVLLVDLSVKPWFDRPRPRDIIELGGAMEYVAPLHVGDHSGNSFVSGHAAAGFYVTAFAMLARSRRIRATIYALGVALGLGIGAVRVIAGAHFVSDIIFSGLIILWTIHLLSQIVLRTPPTQTGARHA